MKRWRWPALLLIVAIGVAGCASHVAPTRMAEGGIALPEQPAGAPEAIARLATDEAVVTEITANGEPAMPERMIIYNGTLSLVVDDTLATERMITGQVEQWEGYIASSDSYAVGNGLMRVELSLRVPAEQFNEAMNWLRSLSKDIRQDSVSSSDVTEEYVDLQSRLKALEAKAERLEELMEKAEDTEAVLAVYRELSSTQQEIEQIKGRMRYLERRSAMASIDVTLIPRESERPIEVGGWEPKGVAKKAIQALIDTYHLVATLVIWFVIFILPICISLYLLYRIVRWAVRKVCRKRKKRPSTEA